MRAFEPKDSKDNLKRKPLGGVIWVGTNTVGLLAWARSKGLLSLRAVRIGFALHELVLERRIDAKIKRRQGRAVLPSRFSPRELGRLCGLPEKRVKSALEELRCLGYLVEFSPDRIRFAASIEALSLSPEQSREFQAWLPTVTKRKRVPVPRRVFKLLLESPSPGLLSVILAACIRCLWLKADGFRYAGRFSAQWISTRFGVCPRAIKQSKKHLIMLGWITGEGSPHKWGDRVTINPAWSRLLSLAEAESRPREGDPSGAENRADSAQAEQPDGPRNAQAPLYSLSSPKGEEYRPVSPPGQKSGPGFFEQASDKKPPETTLPPPRLSAIKTEDLASIERLIGERGLLGQAVKAGLLKTAEADELYLVACAERSRTTDAKNPCGVFSALLKNRRKYSAYISAEQEDAALRRIREWKRQERAGDVPFLVPKPACFQRADSTPEKIIPSPKISPPGKPRPGISKDAEFVLSVREVLKDRGRSESVFHTLRIGAGWTSERYHLALVELEMPPIPGAISATYPAVAAIS